MKNLLQTFTTPATGSFADRCRAVLGGREALVLAYHKVSHAETRSTFNKTVGSCMGWLALGGMAILATGNVLALQVLACAAAANAVYGAVKAVQRQYRLDRQLGDELTRLSAQVAGLEDEAAKLPPSMRADFDASSAQSETTLQRYNAARQPRVLHSAASVLGNVFRPDRAA